MKRPPIGDPHVLAYVMSLEAALEKAEPLIVFEYCSHVGTQCGSHFLCYADFIYKVLPDESPLLKRSLHVDM